MRYGSQYFSLDYDRVSQDFLKLFWRCGTAPCEVIANSFGDFGDLEILPTCEAIGDYTFE